MEHIKVDKNIEKVAFSEKRQNSDSFQLFLDRLGIYASQFKMSWFSTRCILITSEVFDPVIHNDYALLVINWRAIVNFFLIVQWPDTTNGQTRGGDD